MTIARLKIHFELKQDIETLKDIDKASRSIIAFLKGVDETVLKLGEMRELLTEKEYFKDGKSLDRFFDDPDKPDREIPPTDPRTGGAIIQNAQTGEIFVISPEGLKK